MSQAVLSLLERHHVQATQLLMTVHDDIRTRAAHDAWRPTAAMLRVLLGVERDLLVPLLSADRGSLTRRLLADQSRISALLTWTDATINAGADASHAIDALLDAWHQHQATAQAELWPLVAAEADPERRPRVFRRLGAALSR